LLFLTKKSLANARKLLPNLLDARLFAAGHGIETLDEALLFLKEKIGKRESWN
jgi:hypothetical protein